MVAQVPRGSDRWEQVHFNRAVIDQFFRLRPGDDLTATFERVGPDGTVVDRNARRLVFSKINKNPKIEMDFGQVSAYPDSGPPLVVIVELDLRYFRYVSLLPGNPGYDEMLALNLSLPKVGRGLHRGLTNLDEVKLRWPGCPLR